ncbi:MAG: MFS transporter [Xanthobacteraceae bacterium]
MNHVMFRGDGALKAASARALPHTGAVDPRRWWVLWTLAAAQFMFVVDAFIVNVAIPTIRADLHASAAQIEAVITICLIAYATLVIIGGRLGDIFGAKSAFLSGLIGFTVASIWCGLARSGGELIAARLVQGATAALMVPQVLATIHVLFPDGERPRAFAIYGLALGCGGAAGFLLGGFLVTFDVAGAGWRTVFFVNAPLGLTIAGLAWRLMPRVPRRLGAPLDLAGASVLFAGLLCLVGPLLFGGDFHWAPWLWLVMLLGVLVIAGFLALERRIEHRGGHPLISSALVNDRSFRRGLAGAFCFFAGNLSFYLVLTLFLQDHLGFSPWDAGLTVLPLALTFVAASRHGAARSVKRGAAALIDGCVLQIVGLGGLALLAAMLQTPAMLVLALPLTVFGYGQGLVMAPLSSMVLSTVQRASAGSGSGVYATTVQIANALGVAAIGALFFTVQDQISDRAAFLAALAAVAGMITASALLLASRPASNGRDL